MRASSSRTSRPSSRRSRPPCPRGWRFRRSTIARNWSPATFVLMRQFGLSANLMSLGGLAIAIGLLVDAAVVVGENVVAHLAHDPEDTSETPLQRVLWATQEVARPVTSGIAIIAIVFLPLLTLQGLEGKLFA